jgi:hypothetical protein
VDLTVYLQELLSLFRRPPAKSAETTKTRYTDQQLDEFERSMSIRLPERYRLYMREVGAGQLGAVGFISMLEDWCQPEDPETQPRDFLSQPFPHTGPSNDLSLKDAKLGWGAPYYDDNLWRGAMRITDTGCESYHLLVVSGPEYGNVWSDERATASKGIFPLVGGEGGRVSIEEYLLAR